MRTALSLGALSIGALILIASIPAPPAPRNIVTTVEPVSTVVTAGAGGTVRRLRIKPGDQVHAGQLLVELDVPELGAAGYALQIERLAAGIPREARASLIDAHRAVLDAEAEYVAALAEVDQHPQDAAQRRRLQQATLERQLVRRRVSSAFDAAPAGPGSLAALEKRLRAQADLRASADAAVALVNVHPGDHVTPGQPLALLSLAGEYFAEFVSDDQLRPGTVLTAKAGPRQLKATVETVTARHVPFAFRTNRQRETESAIRIRLQSAEPIAAGTPLVIHLP